MNVGTADPPLRVGSSDEFGWFRSERMTMKLTTWTVIHAAHWALLYFAFSEGVDGALNLVKFWVWIMTIASPFLLTDAAIRKTAGEQKRPVRSALTLAQAWVTLTALLWFGHIASGTAWAFVMLCCAVHRDASRKLRGAAA